MSAWSNNDKPNSKPKWDVERQTREFLQFTVLTGNTAGNTVISVSYNDGGLNNVANIGVAAGQYVYFMANGFGAPGGTAGNGYPSMFFSNTTISSVSGNTVVLANPLFNTVSAGYGVEFDKAINYGSTPVANTYNRDTIMVTSSRLANSTVSIGNLTTGWNHIRKKVNNDGTVRYIHETLVA